jgi:hypothetical protein
MEKVFSRLVTWILVKAFPVLEEHKELIKIFSNILFTFFLLYAVTLFAYQEPVVYCNSSISSLNFTLPNNTLTLNYTVFP